MKIAEFCPECSIGLSNMERDLGYCQNCGFDVNNEISENAMNDYHNEIAIEANAQVEKDSKTLAKIHSLASKEFYKDFLEWLSYDENGVIGHYKILEKPKGEFQTEEGFGLIKGMWVDQYTTPMIEYDYHGYLTVKLENGKYFECSFNLG